MQADLATAIDQPGLLVSSGSAIPWKVTTTKDGSVGPSAAHNGDISENQSSRMSAWVVGPGKLDFRWFVSSEWNSDFVQFHLDGKLVAVKSDIVRDWRRVDPIELTTGIHRLDWTFVKDGVDYPSDAEDTAWIDDLRLFGYTAYMLSLIHI